VLALKELSNYLKHSSQIHPSCHLISAVTELLHFIYSPNIDNGIGNEGAIKLAEVLKSNKSLTSLDLCCN
jgi:hypothetical protein